MDIRALGRDIRVLKILAQLIFVIVLALIAALPGAVVLFLSRRTKVEKPQVVTEGLGQPREQELALAG